MVYLRMCSSATSTASVVSYEPAQDDALPKSHSTHVPLLCSRMFSALRSLLAVAANAKDRPGLQT